MKVYDIEPYWNVFLFGAKRISDGKTVIMEESDRSTIDRDLLRRMLLSGTWIGFNSMSYDQWVTWAFVNGASVEECKRISNLIIQGRLRYWEVEEATGVRVPWDFKQNHIDLIEPQPNPIASLKTLHARLHGVELRDLPYDPEQRLSHAEIDQLRVYLERSDLPATEKLWHAMSEGMDLRRTVGESIGQNVMSLSDTQMGLAIIKKRCEDVLGRRIEKPQVKAGQNFRYKAPDYIQFKLPVLRDILERIQQHEFIVGADGKVDLPKWLSDAQIQIGPSTFAMGIGGLHSTESNRCVRADDDNAIVSGDVASYYPAIILSLGLYPEAVGPAFLKVYESIRADRLAAKKAKNKAIDKALKIALNGAFGSLGSKYKFVFAPHLLIAVTLTGQLALLMLIERAFLAGIPTISANTDGAEFFCPRKFYNGMTLTPEGKLTNRLAPSVLAGIMEQWERDTKFDLEFVEYTALYNQSVNSYFALKADGGHKRKGPLANPWSEDPNDKDARGALMKNPQATICSDAALRRIKDGVPVAQTIRECRDIRQFITVIKVTKGATWRGRYLGKVIRYYYSTDGDEIFESKPNEKTGNYKKVPKTDGAKECMTLPDEFPSNIDYARYEAEAEDILKDIGFFGDVRPPEKRIRLRKDNKLEILRTWMVMP